MNRLNLMVHCGGNQVERNELDLVKTPPRQGEWTPVPHAALLEQVTDSLTVFDYQVVAEAHALARAGNHYFGMLQISARATEDRDYSLVVGLRNSHNKAFAAGLVVGSGVFVCDNLAFSGEIKIARKHTTNIYRDLPMLTHTAISKLTSRRVDQDKRIDAYKLTRLSPKGADHLIISLLRARVITTQQVVKVVTEWDNPSHPEFAEDGNTVWRLFNATTETLKGSLTRLPRATQTLHGVMDNMCRLPAPLPLAA